MAVSIWDPANLLQVTMDVDDTYGEIQCVGLAKFKNRCRWTIEDPDRSKVRPLLMQISQTKPESVELATLRRLACLCLCPSYHRHQAGEVVERWIKVIKRAAQHHKNLTGSLNKLDSKDLASQRTELDKTQRELVISKRRIAELEKRLNDMNELETRFRSETRAVKTAAEEVKEENIRLLAEVAYWKDQHKHERADRKLKEVIMLDLQRSSQTLSENLRTSASNAEKSEKNAAIAKNDLQEMDKKYHDLRLEKLEMIEARDTVRHKLAKIEEEKTSTIDHLEELQKEARVSAKAREQLETDIEKKNGLLHTMQGRMAELERNVANLQARAIKLQESIARCWMHRFWMKLSRVGKRPDPTNEDAA